MQMRIAAAYLLLATGTLWGAGLADYTWFHIQASGDNLNGGGFNPANTGTNYALGRTTKRLTANGDSTDLSVTDAATTSGSTTVTSAGANFTSALAGNVVYLAGERGASRFVVRSDCGNERYHHYARPRTAGPIDGSDAEYRRKLRRS